MGSTAKGSQPSKASKQVSGPAPLKWYVLLASAWLCSTAAYAVRDFTSDALHSSIRIFSVVLLIIAMYIRWGRKVVLGSLGISALATLLVFLLSPHGYSSSREIVHLLTSALLLLPLYLEALRARGVELRIVKDSALPALGLLLIGSLLYFVLEEVTGLPPLTAEWVWLLGGTLWIVSAGLVARKYL